MAGTVTKVEETNGSITKITYDWLSDASGDVSASATTAILDGQIIGVLFEPDSGGTAPSDLYDVTLLDADSRDLLFGQGMNLPQALDVAVLENLGQITNDALSLVVDNAGNAKGGVVVVYVR